MSGVHALTIMATGMRHSISSYFLLFVVHLSIYDQLFTATGQPLCSISCKEQAVNRVVRGKLRRLGALSYYKLRSINTPASR